MSESTHLKGQSRVLKVCHWCAKKQESEAKPFQACSRCKEVIYCSKACQVASWPLHKTPCKMSAGANAALSKNPVAAQGIANFKKWHGLHIGALRHAAICALDLGHNPKGLEDGVIFVEVKLKSNHNDFLLKRKYEPTGGFTLTMKETREMIGKMGGDAILDSIKEANLHMQTKGALGVATLILQAHDMVDVVKVILPSPASVHQEQDADNWGQFWFDKLRLAVELD